MASKQWRELGQRLLIDRPPCVVCGEAASNQLHHGLYKCDNRKGHPEYARYIDVEINACPSCPGCNVDYGRADTRDFLERFVIMQIEKFGLDVVQAWVTDFPAKLKLGDEWKQLARLVELVLW